MTRDTGLRFRLRAARLAACAVAVLACAPDAQADTDDAKRKADAHALFYEARKLTAEGKHAEACPKLAASLELHEGMGTRFYLAECLEHTGKLASAWTHYVAVTEAAKVAGQGEREKYARERAQALEPRLTRLMVVVSDDVRSVPGIEVWRNDAALVEAEWGEAVPVDSGLHTVSVTVSGAKRWTTTAEVKQEGQTVTVVIPPLESAEKPEAPPAESPRPAAVPPPQGPRPSPPPNKIATSPAALAPKATVDRPNLPFRTAGFIAGGVGLVGLGIGTAFGIKAINKNQASDPHCDESEAGASDACDPTGGALREESKEAAAVSSVGFVAGGVALVAGAVLVLIAPPARKTSSPDAAAAANVVLGPEGISLIGRW